MKKYFILLSILLCLHLSGCTTYTPEDTTHDDVILYDNLEKFLSEKPEKYSLIIKTEETTRKLVFHENLVHDLFNDIIQEPITYMGLEHNGYEPRPAEYSAYRIYEGSDDGYVKYLTFDDIFYVPLDISLLVFDDFDFRNDVYTLINDVECGVDNLVVYYNKEVSNLEFSYTYEDKEYTLMYIDDETTNIPTQATAFVPKIDLINKMYNDFSTADYLKQSRVRSLEDFTPNKYIEAYNQGDDFKYYVDGVYYYGSYSNNTIEYLKGYSPTYDIHTDVFSLFKLMTEEQFMGFFDDVFYFEGQEFISDEIYNGCDVYIVLIDNTSHEFVFDFENNTLIFRNGKSYLGQCSTMYYMYNDESLAFEMPNVNYVDLLK